MLEDNSAATADAVAEVAQYQVVALLAWGRHTNGITRGGEGKSRKGGYNGFNLQTAPVSLRGTATKVEGTEGQDKVSGMWAGRSFGQVAQRAQREERLVIKEQGSSLQPAWQL